MSERTKNILEWIECILIAIILAILIRYFLITPTIVKQESMYPTLKQDERLLLSRWDRTTRKMPERGEIVTFESPEQSKIYISLEDADLEYPVAKYENKNMNIFEKFIYYGLEIGKQSLIKRVIALPGEHVAIKNGKVYINDEELKEDYLEEDVKTDIKAYTGKEYAFIDLIVPENTVFVLGDNRDKSTDSRAFGCIPVNKIEGKVILRFWPFSNFGGVE